MAILLREEAEVSAAASHPAAAADLVAEVVVHAAEVSPEAEPPHGEAAEEDADDIAQDGSKSRKL